MYVPSGSLLPHPWNGKRLGARYTPAGDYDAVMAFEALYYAYSENAPAGAAHPLGFTKWRIMNGLDNNELDFTDSYGGQVFAQIGAGSGNLPGHNGSAIAGGAGVIIRNTGSYAGGLVIEYKDGERRTMTAEKDSAGAPTGKYFVKGSRGKVIKSTIPDDPAYAFRLGRLDTSGTIALNLVQNGVPEFRLAQSGVVSYRELCGITVDNRRARRLQAGSGFGPDGGHLYHTLSGGQTVSAVSPR